MVASFGAIENQAETIHDHDIEDRFFLANDDKNGQGQNCKEACEAKGQSCDLVLVDYQLQKPHKQNLTYTRDRLQSTHVP